VDIEDGTITAAKLQIGSIKDIDANAAIVSELFSGDYDDLSGLPTLGDLAALDKISNATYIANGVIITDHLAADSVTTAKIKAGAVTATEIGANAVTSAKIQAGAVTAEKIDVANLFGETI